LIINKKNIMISLSEPNILKEDIKRINKLLKSKKLVDGFYQNKTQKLIQNILKAKYVALTQSCSDALEAGSLILGLKKGDEVLVPSFTFTSTVNSFMMFGAKPIFVDIDKETLNIDLDDLNNKITSRSKAIYVVHYGGISCDIDKLKKIATKRNLFILEDAAHGFLGKYKNKYLGTFGDISTLSFHATKNFTGGQCGALIINNKKLKKSADYVLDKGTDRLKKLNYKKGFLAASLLNKKFYSWRSLGSEYRASEISACLLYGQLLRRNKIQSVRKKIWMKYYDVFKKYQNDQINLININKNIIQAYHQFVIIFKNKNLANKLIDFLQKNKITATFHYIPLHLSPFIKNTYKKKISLKNTEEIYSKLVRLPLHSNLTENQVNFVINKIKVFLISYILKTNIKNTIKNKL